MKAAAGLLLFAGRLFQEAAQSLRCLIAIQFTSGEVEHQFLPLFTVRRRLDSNQPQENNRGQMAVRLLPSRNGWLRQR